ncbi:MAG TPA: zinc ribbon domain-containing protein, partial [Nitrospiria bacterium]|nr:zinc ribbon domain-containing protein [Nitrospiria bacterium]
RRDFFHGDDLHKKSGKWYKKERIIDKDNDQYKEVISDPETGEIIHECQEPLSEHRNHGSAKNKDDKKA